MIHPQGQHRILVSEIVLGGLLSLVVMLGVFGEAKVLRTLERAAYDLRASSWGEAEVSEQIVIVAVDQESLDKVGRWPWPRGYVGQLLDHLHRYGAKLIGLGFPVSEPDHALGVRELHAIERKVTAQAAALARVKELRALRKTLKAQAQELGTLARPNAPARDPELRFLEEVYRTILRELREAQLGLDQDTQFAKALVRTSGALLPVTLDLTADHGQEFPEPDGAVLANTVRVPLPAEETTPVATTADLRLPLPKFLHRGVALGHIHIQPDEDGVVRHDLLLVQHGPYLLPSFALRALSLYLDVPLEQIQVIPGQEIVVGSLHVPTDPFLRLRVRFNGTASAFKVVPAQHVLAGKVGADAFRDKLVLIGPVTTGNTPWYRTAAGTTLSGVEVMAASLQTLLTQRFVAAPLWVPLGERLMLVGAAGLLVLALPRLGLGSGALLVGAVAAAWAAVGLFVLVSHGYVMAVLAPGLLLGAGFLLVAANRTLFAAFSGSTRAHRAGSEVQLIKAVEATDKRGGQPDLLGKDGTVVMDPAALRRTLGRYEIVRELGRGAMGVVYLCRDPNINRYVAIKTLRLDEVDPEQLEQVKARFFREAQSAGQLSHPNIVTIYDAGEEGNLGYIVMEVLDGVDLKAQGKKDLLLPIPRVLEIVAKVAEALDYAHRQGIVHRDIKPSNIMVMKNGTVKVTDFGIARIITGSRTETGVVIGTPGYMSPEQLTGAKVDGRSDIFSLGVVLFELLTGETPFEAEDVTTLMYQIANQPHRPPRTVRPDLPASCAEIIDRALQKEMACRYQRASEMAEHLLTCLREEPWLKEEDSPGYAASGRHQNRRRTKTLT